VRISAEQDQLSAAVEIMTKQHTVLVQKRIRVEAEISMQEAEALHLEREIHRLQVDLTKLDSLLYTEEGTKNVLQQENQMLETLFLASLKVTISCLLTEMFKQILLTHLHVR
jgi:BRE1 E3 ubiquitin ligase